MKLIECVSVLCRRAFREKFLDIVLPNRRKVHKIFNIPQEFERVNENLIRRCTAYIAA